MAILSNINDKFAVDSTGAIQFNGQAGTSGYILKSNGNAAPTWVAASTVIGGPYLPLSGGTLTGATATASGISFTVGGVLTVNTASSNIFTLNRTTSAGGYMKFQNNGTDKFYIGSRGTISGSGGVGYDIYTVSGNDIRLFPGTSLALTLDTSANATFAGSVIANNYISIKTASSSGSPYIDFLQNTTQKAYIQFNDGANALNFQSDNAFTFIGGSAERVRIDGAGNVGIGTTSPDLGAVAGTRVLTIASPTAERWGILELAGNRTWGGNQVGELKFISTDSTNNGTLVSLTAINDPSATGTGGSLKFSTRPNGGSLTERMRIFSNGNVNIGVAEAGASAVTGPFVVTHTSSRFLTSSYEESSVSLSAKNGNNNLETLRLAGDSIKFFNGTNAVGSQKMVILNSGSVGIGTASPARALDIVATADSTPALRITRNGDATQYMEIQAGGADTSFISRTASVNSQFKFISDVGGSQTTRMIIAQSGNVGIGTTSPNATLHVNGGVHFGTDSAVINPTNGQVLIETVAGGTPRLQMYVYGSSVFDIHSDGTTANIGWSSGASREVNFQNTGAGDIKVGIATGAPTQPLDVSGYSICDKQLQRDNTLQTIVYTPRVLNIGYRGANGTYTFNPISLFGSLPQGGQCVLQVTGWRAALNNGIIHWVDNGSNTNIGAGQVYYTQTAYKAGGQSGSNTISVSNSSGTNNITIAFTGWHSNSHGWNCKLISYQA